MKELYVTPEISLTQIEGEEILTASEEELLDNNVTFSNLWGE